MTITPKQQTTAEYPVVATPLLPQRVTTTHLGTEVIDKFEGTTTSRLQHNSPTNQLTVRQVADWSLAD